MNESRTRWKIAATALSCAWLLAAGFAMRGNAPNLFAKDLSANGFFFADRFSDDILFGRQHYGENIVREIYGFATGTFSLTTPAQSDAWAEYRFTLKRGQRARVKLKIWAAPGKKLENEILVSRDGGQTFIRESGSKFWKNQRLDLTRSIGAFDRDKTDAVLKLVSRNGADYAQPSLDAVEICVDYPPGKFFPNLPAILGSGMLFFLFGLYLPALAGKEERAASQLYVLPVVLSAFAGGLIAAAPAARIPLYSFIFLGVLFQWAERRRRNIAYAFPVALLLIWIGFTLRWDELMWMAQAPPERDARGYLEFAKIIRPFTDAGFYSAMFEKREPLFILIASWVVRLFGPTDFHLRYLSFILSVAVMPVAWLIFRRRMGEAAGLVSLAVIAFSQSLVSECAKGLRTELETLLWLLVFFVGTEWRLFALESGEGDGKEARAPGPGKPAAWAAALGASGGLLLLCRSNNLPALLLMFFACGLASPLRARRWIPLAGAAFLLSVAMLFPHKHAIYLRHGSYMWDNARYARWHANREFIDRLGSEGFPTEYEYLDDGHAGPPLSMFDYFFKMHTFGQLAGYHALGYAGIIANLSASIGGLREEQNFVGKMLLDPLARPYLANGLPMILRLGAAFLIGIAALLLACAKREGRMAAAALLFCTLFSAFLFGANLTHGGRVLEPYRTIMHAFPFFAACIGLAAGALFDGWRARYAQKISQAE